MSDPTLLPTVDEADLPETEAPVIHPPDPRRMELAAGGLLTITEAVSLSKLSRSELYERMTAGEIAYAKLGRRRLVSKLSLVEFIARGLC